MKLSSRIPGSRWFLYAVGLTGLVHAVEESLQESNAPSEPIDPSTPVEYRDVNARLVLITGIGLLLGIWAVVVGVYPLFNYFKYARTGGLEPSKVLEYLPRLPPQPRNDPNPLADFDNFEVQEEEALNSYNWVDRGKGVVSIPIERAMQILAQRGIPPAVPGGKEYYTPAAGTKVTGFEGKVEPTPR